MEWFVVGIFIVFISGLIWVSVEAVTHANKTRAPNKKNAAER